MAKFVEQIKFNVFCEKDGRWQIVADYAVETMAKEHVQELERAGHRAGYLRIRTRMPPEQ